MSRLVRIAAAMLFLTVLVAPSEPVKAHGGHYDCRYWGSYHPWDIYDCGWLSCEEANGIFTSGSCFMAACYQNSGDDGETTVVYHQCQ
jgi:hypothetical protein